jgi:hypothetical protein
LPDALSPAFTTISAWINMLAGDRASGNGPTRGAPFVAGKGRGDAGEDAEAADDGPMRDGGKAAAGALVVALASAGAVLAGVETMGAVAVERLSPAGSSARTPKETRKIATASNI